LRIRSGEFILSLFKLGGGFMGKESGRPPKWQPGAISQIMKLRLKGYSFSQIGGIFDFTSGWASNLYYQKKKENKKLLDSMVSGLLSCPKHPPIELNKAERFGGGSK
jgi:hypothetical protein